MDTKMENQNEKVNETPETKTTPAAPAAEKPAEKPAEAAAAKPAAPKPAAPKAPTGPAYNLTVSVSPHAHSNESTRSIMLDVIIALLPALDVYKRQAQDHQRQDPPGGTARGREKQIIKQISLTFRKEVAIHGVHLRCRHVPRGV